MVSVGTAGRSSGSGRAALASLVLGALVTWAAGCGGRAEPTPDASEPRAGVTHLAIDRALDVGTQALLQRAIRSARAKGDDTLIVEIDTPGGELGLMSRYAGMIEEASRDGLRTVAWVSGEATSAGALIAMACERVYMRASSTLGSSGSSLAVRSAR